MKMMQEV